MVEELILNEDSSLNCAVFGNRTQFEISSKKLEKIELKDATVGPGIERVTAVRMYFSKDGKRIAALGYHSKDYGKSFYAPSFNFMKPCFILFNNNSVSSIDYAEETGSISSENEIFFNDKGKPEAYSYKNKDGKTVTKKL